MEILHIECATFESSVALAKNGELIEQINLPDIGISHSATLPLAIDELLQKHSNFKPKAIAVSKGPGSYTGLRIGTSIAKGLCLGFNIPLIGIDTLEIIANGMVKANGNFEIYHAMLKARNTEVYSAKFSSDLSRISETEPLQLEPLPENIELGKVCFGGNGATHLEGKVSQEKLVFEPVLNAKNMIEPALNHFKKGGFEDLIEFEPFYLKAFKVGAPSKKIANILGLEP